MWRVALKGMLEHKGRFALSAVAVVLGVAFMAGTLVFTDTIQAAFDDVFARANEGTDAVVRGASKIENEFGEEQRSDVSDFALRVVRDVDGVAAAVGSVEGFAVISDREGEPIVDPSQGPPALAVAWPEAEQLNPLDLVAGEPPQTPSEVVIDKASADEADYEVGDATRISTKSGSASYTITGIAQFADVDSPLGASIAAFEATTAQQLLGTPGRFNFVAAAAEEGVSQEDLVTRIGAALEQEDFGVVEVPEGADTAGLPADSVEVITGEQLDEETSDQIAQQLSFFNTFLLIFALVAVVVGIFVILNSLLITVAQRTREMALLRALGASRGQVLRAVLLEALVTGVVASGVGLLAGVGLSILITRIFEALGIDIPAGGTVLAMSTIVVSVVVGVGITMLAAMYPAWRASRVPPLAALRDVAAPRHRYLWFVLGGSVLTGLGALAVLIGLFGEGDNALPLVGLGVFMVFVGVAFLGPAITPRAARVLGARPVGWVMVGLGALVAVFGLATLVGGAVDANVGLVVFGVLVLLFSWAYIPSGRAAEGIQGRLGRENARRNPGRSALTASALMIGVGLVAFITIFGASARAAIDDIIDDQVQADFVVSAGFGNAGLSPQLADQIAGVEGVALAEGVRGGPVRVYPPGEEPKTVPVSATDPVVGGDLWDLGFVDGSIDDLVPGTIGLEAEEAEALGVGVGDSIDLEFLQTGRQTFEVAALYENEELAGSYTVTLDDWEANVADQFDFIVAVAAADGADLEELRERLQPVVDEYPNGTLETADEFSDSQADQINAFLNLIYGLLAFAVIIAGFGIANVLALSILERTRELGLLRAVGMSRSQVRRTVRWEAVIIALIGTALGVVIGLVFSYVLVLALEEEGFNTYEVPWLAMVVIAVIGSGVGVISALLPARRAAELDVLEAIATE